MIHRYRFISDHHAVYGVARLCRVLAVKRRQGYYEWLAAQPARQARAEDEDELAAQIRATRAEARAEDEDELAAQIRATRAEARQAAFAYITYYNHNRLHSTLQHRTPHEARVCYRQPIALAA
jgi:transposase InsO family protein